ncbi:hypothetical protein GA0115252_14222 [Streptomyces sp. DfronAA-171]|nr:hypothetical protein GA0115252_14222 [Streptomyces sp. DfronAA-171]
MGFQGAETRTPRRSRKWTAPGGGDSGEPERASYGAARGASYEETITTDDASTATTGNGAPVGDRPRPTGSVKAGATLRGWR